jgi:DNA-directed RNA polymerase subunit N (RpoN/RPB10)
MIPIKCFTCGKVIASLYRRYVTTVNARKCASNKDIDRIQYLTKDNCEKTIEANVMDELGVDKVCCRRILMTHRDI